MQGGTQDRTDERFNDVIHVSVQDADFHVSVCRSSRRRVFLGVVIGVAKHVSNICMTHFCRVPYFTVI